MGQCYNVLIEFKNPNKESLRIDTLRFYELGKNYSRSILKIFLQKSVDSLNGSGFF